MARTVFIVGPWSRNKRRTIEFLERTKTSFHLSFHSSTSFEAISSSGPRFLVFLLNGSRPVRKKKAPLHHRHRRRRRRRRLGQGHAAQWLSVDATKRWTWPVQKPRPHVRRCHRRRRRRRHRCHCRRRQNCYRCRCCNYFILSSVFCLRCSCEFYE